MILENFEPKLDNKEYGEVYPRYNGQSLANVPHTLMKLLGAKTNGIPINEKYYAKLDASGIKKVAFILLDGFGYKMWMDSWKNPGFFNTMSKKGIVLPITSVFPSTTASAVTTANTGLTPIQHGLPEWQIYFHEIKMIINTLPFTPYYPQLTQSLTDKGIKSSILYNGKTIYEQLARQGVSCTSITNRVIANGLYTKIIKKGSKQASFVKPTDGVLKLKHIIESERKRAYVQLYIDNIDASTHAYGPFSEESRAEINSISNIFEKQLLEKIGKRAAEETLVVVTSDHGHSRINPSSMVYLNNDRKLTELLAIDGGKKILPTGSPRDVFLHIKKGQIETAVSYLQDRFSKVDDVMTTTQAIEMGLYGMGKPNKKFMDRVGDVLILPKEGESIWYEHIKGKKYKLIGVHGGLTKNEMLTPLAMARL
ncbi:MAG: alkaline phosphatase family protein, partial [Candidatus Micrarchaeota archaeon]|nr:alkaline phosphatase family protein [Candidatus Micrarchaeota archaeon]